MSYLEVSRTFLVNDDNTPFEIKKMWMFLTMAGILIHVFICSFDINRLNSLFPFEADKNPLEE